VPAFVATPVNYLFVSRDVKRIFEHRHGALLEAFDAAGTGRPGPVTIA
jgi:hypothetical protein